MNHMQLTPEQFTFLVAKMRENRLVVGSCIAVKIDSDNNKAYWWPDRFHWATNLEGLSEDEATQLMIHGPIYHNDNRPSRPSRP